MGAFTIGRIYASGQFFGIKDIVAGAASGHGKDSGSQNGVPEDGVVVWNNSGVSAGLLTLVNADHPMSSDWKYELVQLKNGQNIDSRAYEDLQQMMDDARAEGLDPYICSSWRSHETQEQLFEEEIASYVKKGYSKSEAKVQAAQWVAVPGTSEHQLGLTVDVVDINNQNLTEEQEKTPTQKWLMANSWRYGFIHRYPNGKSAVTGIIYEPWHYRYVGKDVAQEIFNRGITLEEYLGVPH